MAGWVAPAKQESLAAQVVDGHGCDVGGIAGALVAWRAEDRIRVGSECALARTLGACPCPDPPSGPVVALGEDQEVPFRASTGSIVVGGDRRPRFVVSLRRGRDGARSFQAPPFETWQSRSFEGEPYRKRASEAKEHYGYSQVCDS